mgnify:FL=1
MVGQTVTIRTKGVEGMKNIVPEFNSNILNIVGGIPLERYGANVVDLMQEDAPVLTGYLKNHIKSYRVNRTTVAVTSWAPYSGPAEVRSKRPFFFRNNALPSAPIGGALLGDASFQYFKTLINKYQNRP